MLYNTFMGQRSVQVSKFKIDCFYSKQVSILSSPTATWSQWSSWTGCSVSCGSGTKYRRRACNQMPPYTNCTEGSNIDTVPCERQQCPASKLANIAVPASVPTIILISILGVVAFKYRSAIRCHSRAVYELSIVRQGPAGQAQ